MDVKSNGTTEIEIHDHETKPNSENRNLPELESRLRSWNVDEMDGFVESRNSEQTAKDIWCKLSPDLLIKREPSTYEYVGKNDREIGES
jgi:hypothetical protein